MASHALDKWRGRRAVRLDRLEITHATLSARTLAEGLTRALVLQLAAEFQGFARDLHDEAANALVVALAPGSRARQILLIAPYERHRRLARGNASPANLSEDFGLFGLELWYELRRRYPSRSRQWLDRLTVLNDVRNGLAHADDQKVAKAAAAGWPLTLASARRWRGTLDRLASGMDRVVREHLRSEFGVKAW